LGVLFELQTEICY